MPAVLTILVLLFCVLSHGGIHEEWIPTKPSHRSGSYRRLSPGSMNSRNLALSNGNRQADPFSLCLLCCLCDSPGGTGDLGSLVSRVCVCVCWI
ncbi:hypothetical protein PF005_g30431 [Phytophthora fragariae]|uniref:RxLR effector protein n=1 Tax=Phytophthora fragariae TaxID=53985 RepID=A0A6A3XIG9_9STRA|nr:hypothetical protein PF003_g17701 [Phytophthora fragariae]KAE8920677.1 hypothetical protein PF009_g29034 [Phytophthora fragariae]KAE9065423.1 hypothetical protein PF007_g28846 [Phytophthora fragariae]KAE9070172.1 hypothetical protein PF010_g26386 [Phytophthora fragariae]KAE9077830.1 hypothetical protein PF006_g27844 [Phytophthora fragariae]